VRIVAIVLAAGEGRRMGGPKALLRLGSTSFLARACQGLAAGGVGEVVAVTGAEAERVLREAALPDGVRAVRNEAWRSGMLSSVLAGLAEAERLEAGAVLLHPVDNPLVRPETVAAVVAALRAGAFAAVPSHGGRRGHPAGFSREAWPALRAVSPERGARGVLADNAARIVHVAAGADCLVDVDTPGDYADAVRR
jgi:molybdenum cofactor cytidylyltransferase